MKRGLTDIILRTVRGRVAVISLSFRQKVFIGYILLSILLQFANAATPGIVKTKSVLEKSIVLTDSTELHLTDSTNPFKNGSANLTSEDSWLYLDNVRPSLVLKRFTQSILVNGKPLQVGNEGNGRIAIYRQGSVIIPQSSRYQPLQTFAERNFNGKAIRYDLVVYYTNQAGTDIPPAMVKPLEQDNRIRSFKLKKGYMATFSSAANGIGYSRVFIADTGDLTLPAMPVELDQNISFIRVFPWQWPSKKGWCGGRGDMVQATGKNRQDNEIELTRSSWFYSWGGADPVNLDAEFVAMKWGTGGKMDAINGRTDITHLLGHNEPNRPDQSNISVETSLADWPRLMQSGLRLGSPSVSDNSRLEDWLYKFIDEADNRNYRVDYVAVHAYWSSTQMPDAKAWYHQLRDIHLRTGRPIWVTEWNNGANWTKEQWPSEQDKQFAKQNRELSNIIRMLDTASFVERYSIYNWVEDKRAIIIDSLTYKEQNGKKTKDQLVTQTLTPAGEWYRANEPPFAFNPQNEVTPNFSLNLTPVLTYTLTDSKNFKLNWDAGTNQEMVKQYVVERSADGSLFQELATKIPTDSNMYVEPIQTAPGRNNSAFYRVKVISKDGNQAAISNNVSFSFIANRKDVPDVRLLSSSNKWSLFQFQQSYSSTPFLLFGTPTNHNKIPQTHRLKNGTTTSFEFKFSTWQYLKNPVLSDVDTIACLLLPKPGIYQFGAVAAVAATLNNVKESWATVHFAKPFAVVPVVFASQVSSGDDATTSVRIKNVTKEGFDIMLQYEAAYAPFNVQERVNYVALTPGKGMLNGKKMEVGITEENAVGDFFNFKRIALSSVCKQPALFGFMQTETDGVTSALRIKSAGNNFIELFKEKEISKGPRPLAKETVGWMVIESAN